MEEFISNAKEELKRVDHLIYVSLKYTRTVDVILNVVNRLINAFDFMIDDLLTFNESKLSAPVPSSPAMKCDILKELLKDDTKIIEYLNFYMLLRKLSRAKYKRINEFRRHVAMIADVDGKTVEVSIDVVSEYYKSGKECLEYINKLKEGEHD